LIHETEFISGITREDLIWLPGNTPTCSNYAFILLGYVVEAFTGKSLQDVITDTILHPLGMSSASGLQIQDDASKIIIPAE
jgi:CubicO group peptidase (beta-lactamase class C family)